jgi:hypothetical protein
VFNATVEFVRCPESYDPTFYIFGVSSYQHWTLLDTSHVLLRNVTVDMRGYTAYNYDNHTFDGFSKRGLGSDLYFEAEFKGTGAVFAELDPNLESEVTILYRTFESGNSGYKSSGIANATATLNYTGSDQNPFSFVGVVQLLPCRDYSLGYSDFTAGCVAFSSSHISTHSLPSSPLYPLPPFSCSNVSFN